MLIRRYPMLAGTWNHLTDPAEWARCQSQGAKLKHSSRRRRVMTIAGARAEQPGKTIPEVVPRKSDIEATSAFCDRPEATPDAIQAGHRDLVKGELRAAGRYLLIEETSSLSFTHRRHS